MPISHCLVLCKAKTTYLLFFPYYFSIIQGAGHCCDCDYQDDRRDVTEIKVNIPELTCRL